MLLLSIIGFTSITHCVLANVSAKAQLLGLTNTWSMPMPSDDTPPDITAQYLSSNWHTTNKRIYGSDGVSFIDDPIDKTKNATVLKVEYPSGSYAPVGSRSKAGIAGGVEFFSSLSEDHYYNSALLSYDIAFDSSFRWIKGGKLPGIYGGDYKYFSRFGIIKKISKREKIHVVLL
jgi:hypothetical protein